MENQKILQTLQPFWHLMNLLSLSDKILLSMEEEV